MASVSASQAGGIEPLERRERAQMPLAVGMERVAALRDRRLQADRGQRVLQRAPLAHMHVHVAGGGYGQAGGSGDGDELLATRRIVGVEQALGGDPQRVRETRGEPARLLDVGRAPRQPQRKAAGDTVGNVGARQAIAALDRAAAAAGDERSELAVARAIGGEEQEAQTVVETEFTADEKPEAAFLRFDMRAHHAGERAFVGDCERRVT